MPHDAENRIRTPFAQTLDLPPPFHAVALREVGDAFAYAVKIASEAGAGTLVHVGRYDFIEFAVVLEPEEPLYIARCALYVGLKAMADALAIHAPPEKPISFDWPATIRIDGGLVGGARLAWPADAKENEPPPWLVFGALVRTADMNEQDSGLHPLSTALTTEGFVDIGSNHLLEHFCRHLMAAVDVWHHDGFDRVAKSYLSRLTPEKDTHHELDENGDLLVHHANRRAFERRPLLSALGAPSWLDPAASGPRL